MGTVDVGVGETDEEDEEVIVTRVVVEVLDRVEDDELLDDRVEVLLRSEEELLVSLVDEVGDDVEDVLSWVDEEDVEVEPSLDDVLLGPEDELELDDNTSDDVLLGADDELEVDDNTSDDVLLRTEDELELDDETSDEILLEELTNWLEEEDSAAEDELWLELDTAALS